MRGRLLILAGVLACSAAAQPTPAARLAKWKKVDMPAPAGLSTKERQMVDKLVDACRLLDDVFWRQSDLAGVQLYQTTQDPAIKRLLAIMGSRWDLLDENRPLVGAQPYLSGHELYPHDLTRDAIEQYVRQHPVDKAALYSPFTVVKRQGSRLIGAPYHVEYKRQLEPMAKDLRDAAALSDDPAFANFLRLRADALLTDDYYQSDLAWLDLKDPKFDLIFAPYETYLDDVLAVKTSYGASILIRNEEESRRLAIYQRYVPDLQDALPLDPVDRPSKRGHLSPMEVMDAPYRAGDLLHGYQAVADNLPNDPRVHAEKGSKKIFFNNFHHARVNVVILPIAQKLMPPAQAAKASAEGYMAGSVMHEIAHELGPVFARQAGKQLSINEAIGPAYAGIEEAKADVVGMFGLEWLVRHGVIPKDRLEEDYTSYVAGLFRTLRFGTGEAHGRAEMMEFNYLLQGGAVTYGGGRYTIHYDRMAPTIAALAKELLTIEATGNRARAEAMLAKYDTIPAELTQALKVTADIPVDLDPVFALAPSR